MYEKTQKRNPHNLTIRQHVIPSSLIKNFCDHSGKVHYSNFSDRVDEKVTPRNIVFCTKRVWDERAETGYMKCIEDEFLTLSKLALSNRNHHFTAQENMKISKMHLLWQQRQKFRDHYPQDIVLNGIKPPKETWTKDQAEALEAVHVLALNKEGKIPARQMIGQQIQNGIMMLKQRYWDKKWGITYSDNLEFLVPDNPKFNVLPIHPNVCLIEGEQNRKLSNDEVRAVNQHSLHEAHEYFFCHDINKISIF